MHICVCKYIYIYIYIYLCVCLSYVFSSSVLFKSLLYKLLQTNIYLQILEKISTIVNGKVFKNVKIENGMLPV